MEDAEQAEEMKETKILREETMEEITAETVVEEEWIVRRGRKRLRQ